MRSLKKVLALLTVIAMIFSTTAAFGATFKDVDGTDYEAAVVTLSSLDVLNGYEDGTFKPEGDITRAEFAKVIIAVMNMTASAGKTATSFTDVDADNWASGYVKLAEQMGVIKGYGNGKFGPQDNVTYEQAVKMIVAALGFTPKAEALGGYPTGYMVVAAQEEITKGIKADASKAASRGVVAQLVYNALEVEMMEQTGFGSDVTYEQGEKTLLADYLEVTVYEEVQVIANEYTSLSDDDGVEEGKVEIDLPVGADNSETMEVNGTNAAQLLGYTVDVYVNEDDEIISINKSDDMNVELEVMRDDIVLDNTDNIKGIANDLFTYEDKDEEEQDVDLSNNYIVIKNGKFTADADAILPTAGKVVLLDKDDDDKYDIAFVTETVNVVVDEVLESKNMIYFKDGFNDDVDSELNLDPEEDDEYKFVILKDGKEIEIKDLKEWDVISIAADDSDWDDVTLFILYVSTSDVVKGSVSETEDVDTITVDGKEYDIAANIDNTNYLEIGLGDEGKFYLDFYGKIAAFDTEAESDNYAFILDAGKLEGIDASYQVELLNTKGDSKVYDFASKVKYDDVTYDDDEVMTEMKDDSIVTLDVYGRVTSVVPTLITYELNDDGDVKQINVLESEDDGNLDYDESEMNFAGNFYGDEDTIVFVTANDTDDYEVKGISYFDDEVNYTVEAYDIEDAVAKVIVVSDAGLSDKLGDKVAVVDRKSLVKNADDDDVYKLYVLVDGEAKELLTADTNTEATNDDEVSFEDLIRGDVIVYKTDSDGAIDEFHVLLKGGVVADETVLEGMDEDKFDELLVGIVTDKTTRSIEIDDNGYYTIGNAKVYEYDSEVSKGEVSIADKNDISKTDKVLVFKYDGSVKVVVILTEPEDN